MSNQEPIEILKKMKTMLIEEERRLEKEFRELRLREKEVELVKKDREQALLDEHIRSAAEIQRLYEGGG